MATERRKHFGKGQAGFTVYLKAGKDRTKLTISGPWAAPSVEFLIAQIRLMFAEEQAMTAPAAVTAQEGG